MCVDVPRFEIGVTEHGLEEGNRRVNAFYDELLERMVRSAERLRPVVGSDDQLRDQRIVIRGNVVSGVNVGIDPDSRTTGCVEGGDRARGWTEAVLGVFRVDPALDGMAAEGRGLPQGQPP